MAEEIEIYIIPNDVKKIYDDHMRIDPKIIKEYEQKNINLIQKIEEEKLYIDEINNSNLSCKKKIIKYILKEISITKKKIEQNKKTIESYHKRLNKIIHEYKTINFKSGGCEGSWYDYPYHDPSHPLR